MVSKTKPQINDDEHDENFESTLQEFEKMLKEKRDATQEEEPHEVVVKPKRQISESQRESLGRAREMAQLKKKEMKELTEKKKIIQHLKKEENKIDIEDEYNKTIERVVTKKQPKEIEKPKLEQPHQLQSGDMAVCRRKIKKIIYEDEEEEEKPKQTGPRGLVAEAAKEFSYVENTRKSAMQQMQDKINEDRMRFLYQKYILR